MMTRSQRPKMMRRGLLATMVAAALTGVAACGTVSAGSPSTGASSTAAPPASPAATATSPVPAVSGSAPVSTTQLCANLSHLDTLVASLTGVLGRSRLPAVLPAGVTIRDPATVQAVAAALCALPAVGAGPVNCPAAFGGAYRLVFAASGQSYPPVLIKATGCRTVSGLGPVRATSGAFWALLARELGTYHATGGSPAAP